MSQIQKSVLCLIGCCVIGSSSVVYAQKRAGVAAQGAKTTVSHDAALELKRWFAPLGWEKSMDGLKLLNRLRDRRKKRWGLRVSPEVRKRWKPVFQALSVWNPAPLFRRLRANKLDLRLFARLRQWTWIISPPKPQQKPKFGIGHAGMELKLKPVRKLPRQRRRPYRLTFSSYAPALPLRVSQLDKVLQALIERLTDPRLSTSSKPRRLFASVRGQHSKRVANWLASRLPHTAALLDRYFEVRQIMEPVGKGYTRLDLRFRWRAARPSKRKSQTRFQTSFSFHKRYKGRPWLRWTYSQKTHEHRIQGMLYKGGFVLFRGKRATTSVPWRPTMMGASWVSHLQASVQAPNVSAKMHRFLLDWKVQKTKRGASLFMGLAHQPLFRIKGYTSLRSLTSLLVPGGVERLVRTFLYGLAHGDRNRGMRWGWEFVEHPQCSRVHFHFVLPMVPNRKLTSLLRLVPQMRMRQLAAARKRRAKTGRKKPVRAPGRRAGQSFLRGLANALFDDLRGAEEALARR